MLFWPEVRLKNAFLSSCWKALSPDFRQVDKNKCKRTKLFQKVATPLKAYCFFITENKSVNVFHCKQCTLEMYLLDFVSFVLFTSKCSLVFYFLKERTLGKQRFVSSINLQQINWLEIHVICLNFFLITISDFFL